MQRSSRGKEILGGRGKVVLIAKGLEMVEKFLGGGENKLTKLVARCDAFEMGFALDQITLCSVTKTRCVVTICEFIDPPAIAPVDCILDRDLAQLFEVFHHDAIGDTEKICDVVWLHDTRITCVKVFKSANNR